MIKNNFKTNRPHYADNPSRFSMFLKKLPILQLLLIFWLLIIWGHSMQPAAVSSNESGSLLIYVNKIFSIIGLEFTEHIIRKLAHFTEFMILGILLYANISNYYVHKTGKSYHLYNTSLLFGLLAAMIDETIQMFSPGRSCEVKDVWIDFSGVFIGTIICVIFLSQIIKKQNKADTNHTK